MYVVNPQIRKKLEGQGYSIGEYGAIMMNRTLLGFVENNEALVNVRPHRTNLRYQPRLVKILGEEGIKWGRYAHVSGVSGTRRRIRLSD